MRTFLASLLVAGFCLACAQSNQSLLTVLASLETTTAVCDTVTINASNHGCAYAGKYNTYTAVRDKTDANSAVSGAEVRVGQSFSSPDYRGYRGLMQFDLSSLAGKTITAASIFLDGNNNASDTDYTVYVVEGTQAGSLTTDDYNDFTGWGESGAYSVTAYNDGWATTGYSNDWNEIAYNSTGITGMQADVGGTHCVFLLSSKDISGTAPTNSEVVYFETTTPPAHIHITYTEAAPETMKERTVVLSDGVPIPIMFDGSLTPLLVP